MRQITLEKKTRSNLEKRAKPGKMGHTWKNRSHVENSGHTLKKESHLEKWVTLETMGNTWKNNNTKNKK